MTSRSDMQSDENDVALSRLPLPRLQLTWEHIEGEQWRVKYELLIPVDRYDIRDGNDANKEGRKGYIVASMSGGTKVGRSRPPIERDGILDTPFRDGAHANWDSSVLGIPAFVVYKDTYRRLGGDPEIWQNPSPYSLRERS